MQLTASRANNGRYVLLFESSDTCLHAKHIARVAGYTFIFCKTLKEPVAIYCGEKILNTDDVCDLIEEFTEKFTMLYGSIESEYFDALAEVMLTIDSVSVLE